MEFQSPWSRISLRARWAISLIIAIVLVVLLVRFVDHHNGNALAHVSAKNQRAENALDQKVVETQQAPHGVSVPAGTSATAALAAAVSRDMRGQIEKATIYGPLTHVRCVVHGGTATRTGYHCLAEAAHVEYPFLAVVTAAQHHAWFCEKVYPPTPTQNVPVSARCSA